jgi:SnoaL-like domain
MEKLIKSLIKATNAFDVKTALALFAPNAVINDVSVGDKFSNTAGVREYLEKFFVGYHTVTKLDSVEVFDDTHAKAHVDFTGDFGHETGGLDVTVNAHGLIATIDAYLD